MTEFPDVPAAVKVDKIRFLKKPFFLLEKKANNPKAPESVNAFTLKIDFFPTLAHLGVLG